MSSIRRNHHRKPWPATTLDADEQSELALKIRYGIGLEQLVGEQAAKEARRRLSRPTRPTRANEPPPAPQPPDPDATGKAIRRLGRGHQLGRTWRR